MRQQHIIEIDAGSRCLNKFLMAYSITSINSKWVVEFIWDIQLFSIVFKFENQFQCFACSQLHERIVELSEPLN